MADDIKVTIKKLYLFVLNLIPSVESQLKFKKLLNIIIRHLMMNIIQKDE